MVDGPAGRGGVGMSVALAYVEGLAEPVCPYCSGSLDAVPRVHERCASCDGDVWVGSDPDGRLHLLRDDDLPAHTRTWSGHHERNRWIAAAEPFVDELGFGMLESELMAAGRPAEPRDVYWFAAERAIPSIEASGRWDVIRDAYAALATSALDDPDAEMRTERAFEFARRSAAASLRTYGRGRIEIVACECGPCTMDLASAEISRELVTQRLPHPDCRLGWCTCEYRPAGWAIPRVGFIRR